MHWTYITTFNVVNFPFVCHLFVSKGSRPAVAFSSHLVRNPSTPQIFDRDLRYTSCPLIIFPSRWIERHIVEPGTKERRDTARQQCCDACHVFQPDGSRGMDSRSGEGSLKWARWAEAGRGDDLWMFISSIGALRYVAEGHIAVANSHSPCMYAPVKDWRVVFVVRQKGIWLFLICSVVFEMT